MKIIKHGDLKERRFKCEFCGCEFIADCSEYKYIYDFGNDWINVLCPYCSGDNKIYPSNAPLTLGMPHSCRACTTLTDCLNRPMACQIYNDLIEWKESNNESKITD